MIIMNCKIKILPILVILSVLGTGCIEDRQNNVQTNHDLRYNIDKGDRFAYDLISSSEMPKNIRTLMHIKMVVSDSDSDLITTRVVSTTSTNGNKVESSYRLTMTGHGKLIKSESEDLIIPEIQPELPNTVVYPEKAVQKGETWTNITKREGTFTSKEGSINYTVVSTKNYTCLGLKSISCKAGNFQCVGINTDINFTLNMTTKTPNGTVYTIIVGKASGENWVDLRGGFLVKSTYDVNKIIKMDLSEVYKKTGFGVFYRETPINYQTVSELLERK